MIHLTPVQKAEIADLIKKDNKIQAIKKVHDYTNKGLKECKDYVDNFKEK